MHIPADILPAWALWLGAVLQIAALLLALARARWSALRGQPQRVHLVAGGALACLLLWLLNLQVADGLLLHFLGITTLTLVVGWSFSVLAASVALAAFFALQSLDWAALGVSGCLTVLLPATLSRLLLHWLHRPALRHPFVYMLGAGFGGGALVVATLGALALALFALLGLDRWVGAALELWPLLALLMFSEGFINGMCVSALTVFCPDAVKTLDERFYLDDRA